MNYKVSTDPQDIDVKVVHQFISQSYWAKNIPFNTFQKALNHSLCFSVLASDGALVGFARMITDRATFAYLADVFILPEHRGVGLSKILMVAIIEHPELQGLRRMVLATRDAHALYEQFGFKALSHPETFMEVWQPTIYLNDN